ncbi:MAG: CoB--CoM heterodisulfide reductase iron-sulfur subunit B family protein [Acetobacteraceae bacterium]|nr:CoB--CoM heterodisulfide reductase iron-sulfur subunit B family protein [Acetobacteraceae bacterium]
MKYGYYPGCSLHSTGREYDLSTRAVLGRLGLEVEELKGWNCCGATSAHSTSDFLALALPMRNLALAEAQGRDLLAPCAACYSGLRQAAAALEAGEGRALVAEEEQRRITGRPFTGRVRARHPLEVLSVPDAVAGLKRAVRRPLKGLKVAAYYGCLLVRPPRAAAFEDPEQPRSMERLLSAAGAEPVEWSYRTDCCGAGLAFSRPALVGELCSRLRVEARRAGAEALSTACPLCQTNLESRGAEGRLPVFYFTELLGLALDLGGRGSWFRRHLVSPRPLLSRLGLG